MIAGVCAGLSDCYGVNLIFIRIVFAVLGLAQGIGLILYLILMVAIPARPSPEATRSAAIYAPRSPIKTFFACIAGGASVLAALLTLLTDASSIVNAVQRLMLLMNGY
jgi:phage shock protein PspC (stress-responsive transcriptional regulator)